MGHSPHLLCSECPAQWWTRASTREWGGRGGEAQVRPNNELGQCSVPGLRQITSGPSWLIPKAT